MMLNGGDPPPPPPPPSPSRRLEKTLKEKNSEDSNGRSKQFFLEEADYYVSRSGRPSRLQSCQAI